MASNSRSFELTATIRGSHVYQKSWQPELNETLVCIHERRSEFDAFTVKTVCAVDNAIVEHLPREISLPTKYLLDRHATVKAVITCLYYCRSPLFQGGLEIPCSVTVSILGTIRNHLLLDRYRELVTELYCEPKNEIIIGNFLSPTEQIGRKNDRKGFQYQKRKRFSAKTSGFCLDARKRTTRTKIKNKETNETIVID